MRATVLAFPAKRGRGRPSRDAEVEEARMEIDAHTFEERRQAELIDPAIRRLEMVMQEFGPAGWQLYAAIADWHRRHENRWSPAEPETAA